MIRMAGFNAEARGVLFEASLVVSNRHLFLLSVLDMTLNCKVLGTTL